jgi:hypothetical protein
MIVKNDSFPPSPLARAAAFARAGLWALVLSLTAPLPAAASATSAASGPVRSLDQRGPQHEIQDRVLSRGMDFANAAAESALSGLTDGGRARLDFLIDGNGKMNGEGDLFLPFYDARNATAYAQLGARSMDAEQSRDRWIGNAGSGRRWFPQARNSTDSGDWMFGCGAFFDYDFTRSHQRGGPNLEAQYDWLWLSANYYFPLSFRREAKDADGGHMRERAAEGWNLSVKSYLPFYRQIAVTGAYSQWFGDHVGIFSSEHREKDPKVWSCGLEYTPVPLVSGFITRQTSERGRKDTEVGLRFTYHFQMPWEDQTSTAKVDRLRTVSGARHEFVDRENRIVLEY